MAVQFAPMLGVAEFFAPPGYAILTCGVARQLLSIELESTDGRRLIVCIDISGFADEASPWRWLKDVIDLEALWAAS